MKNIFLNGAFLLFILLVGACDGVDDLVTENAETGGLVEVQTPLLSYVVGDDVDYTVSLKVFQGDVKTTKINVLKKFTSGDDVSDEIVLTTIDVTEDLTALYSFTTDFAALREGLTLNGSALPTSDSDLTIGDFWTLTYEAETSQGNTFRNADVTKISVSTRLAGLYTISRGWYIHPSTAPGLASDYSGSYSRVIESVDAVYYRMGDIGPWENEVDNFFYFRVDENNNMIIPKEWNGELQLIWGADELATCADNPLELPDVTCNTTVELSDDGHDIINVSYGYIRSSGTRQFDEILIKQ